MRTQNKTNSEEINYQNEYVWTKSAWSVENDQYSLVFLITFMISIVWFKMIVTIKCLEYWAGLIMAHQNIIKRYKL